MPAEIKKRNIDNPTLNKRMTSKTIKIIVKMLIMLNLLKSLILYSVIKNIIAVIAIILIIYIALQHAPFLKNQEWNPLNDMNNHHQNITQKASQKNNTLYSQPSNDKSYILKDNDIINNVPASQIKTVFNMIDKAEFMSVSGLERMGFNDEYLAGQQGDEFIIYKFGDDYIRVYNTEFEMNEDLNQLKQPINLKPIEAYQ